MYGSESHRVYDCVYGPYLRLSNSHPCIFQRRRLNAYSVRRRTSIERIVGAARPAAYIYLKVLARAPRKTLER